MYVPGQYPVDPRSGEGQLSAGNLEDGQLNCSLNDGDAGAETVALVLGCFAFGFVPAFGAPQLPSPRSFESGSWGGKAEHQCCGQIKDTTTQ